MQKRRVVSLQPCDNKSQPCAQCDAIGQSNHADYKSQVQKPEALSTVLYHRVDRSHDALGNTSGAKPI